MRWVGEYETLVLPIKSCLGDVGGDDVSEPDRAVVDYMTERYL